METVIDIILKVLGYSVIVIVAIIEIIVKIVSLIALIPTLLVVMIVCPILNMEEAPKFFQNWSKYMSENYLRSVKFLKKYYFG